MSSGLRSRVAAAACAAVAGLAAVPAAEAQAPRADRCDPLDPSVCLYPFPSDHVTQADRSTETGRRVDFARAAMPRNVLGKPISPREYRHSDGFSPGTPMITRVPGLDTPEAFRRTGAPPVDDPARSLEAGSPVVVIDARTRERQLVWAELDLNPADPADRTLIVRPAKNLLEGRRYIVALRGMRDADGGLIEAGDAFRRYRDRERTGDPAFERRRRHMESIFRTLARAGIAREELFLAWDFTVASARSTTARMLSIRDRAFAALGDRDLADLRVQGRAPVFALDPDVPDELRDLPELPLPDLPVPGIPGVPTRIDQIDGVQDFTPEQDPRIARKIRGRFVIPCYLSTPGCVTGGRFLPGRDGHTPRRLPGNVAVAQFTCNVPRSALDGPNPAPARVSLYGHGLFGGQGEIDQGQLKSFANEHNIVFCATDWDGMATRDVPNALTVLQDLSRFPTLIDHVQQGFLHFLYLGRLMVHPQGFAAQPAFQKDGRPVIDTSQLFYDGNSQGGIYGGALTAIAPDFQRATLGVPGMNYSTLLRRSVDFDMYAEGSFEGVDLPVGGLYDAYPNELERPLILALIQMLWDRGDPNGYAQHMTSDPLPNTPPHEILLHVAFGDHQVADVSAVVQARSVGARLHAPVLEPGRERFRDRPYPGPEGDSFAGLEPLGPAGYSRDGSGLVFWDSGPPTPVRDVDGQQRGTPAPPAGNVPPRDGRDPHEEPRNTVAARVQKSRFLRPGGTIDDVCGGPCYSRGFRGAP